MKYSVDKERITSKKIVVQPDCERSRARLKDLRNEIGLHFILNSLTTLSHLILTDPSTAHLYSIRLSEVYKYFLINNKKRAISLKCELDFIDNYFYLLQLRHNNKLQLDIHLGTDKDVTMLLPPFSLQVLIENAVKHNEFSNESPLLIAIIINGKYLEVTNRIRSKPYSSSSTHIGLRNLGARYKLTFNKNIIIENGKDTFRVKLPVVWPSKQIIPDNKLKPKPC